MWRRQIDTLETYCLVLLTLHSIESGPAAFALPRALGGEDAGVLDASSNLSKPIQVC
jgi:hypothetical protein